MCDKKIKLKILILYQGEKSKSIKSKIIESLTQSKAAEIKIQQVSADDSFDKMVIKEVEKQIKLCDAAIAIITADERPSSMAGNLWFELGLWWGKKSPKTVLACVQEAPESWSEEKEWIVKVPSDLQGNEALRFTTIQDIRLKLEQFVSKIARLKKAASTHETKKRSIEEKIKDTLIINRGHNITEPVEFFLCSVNDTNCNYRKDNLYFISELLRMGKANREQNMIEICLFKIGKLALQIYSLFHKRDYFDKKNEAPYAIEEHCSQLSQKLYTEFDNLFDTANIFLKRIGSYEKLIKNPWVRLEKYILYRIEVVSKHPRRKKLKFFRKFNKPNNSQGEKTRNFIEWIKIGRKNRDDYSDIEFVPCNVVDEKVRKMINNLRINGNYALEIAEIFSFLGEESFRSCRKCICDNLKKLNNPDTLHDIFAEICNSFPHNQNNSCLPNIWPHSNKNNGTSINV